MWVTFSCVFFALIVLDNFVLNRNPKALTMTRAIVYTLFWIVCAMAFCYYVSIWKGHNEAYMWLSGYMLEWMLSFDNLFVFHMIFQTYGTPDKLKQKPLFLGIIGAVIFRLVFIFVGEYLMHAMFFMHIVFGAFLVYTGVKTVAFEDDEDDPSQQPLVLWLQSKVPFVSAYDENAAFFVNVAVDEQGEPILPEQHQTQTQAATESDGEDSVVRYGTYDFEAANLANAGGVKQRRATMLLLVVFCLEISDILFAVDSVSAIVAQVPDLFLAYTSAVFAMLGLRATFFIIDVLVQLFSLLKYGVGMVLVFIGIKLIISKYYHVPPAVVCLVLFVSIGGSMVASVVQDKIEQMAGKQEVDVQKKIDAAIKSCENTPIIKNKSPVYTPS